MNPSANAMYRGLTRRFKSKKYVDWQKEFDKWAKVNYSEVEKIKLEFSGHPVIQPYRVNCNFYFHKTSLFCKDGRIKKCDVDNRLKALLDNVSKLVGFDDSKIWSGTFEKRVADYDHVDIEIVQHKW